MIFALKLLAYKHLGCFKDSDTRRAISSMEGASPLLNDNHRTRFKPFDKCLKAAESMGHVIFALQSHSKGGAECFSSPWASLTYQMYGKSNDSAECGDDGMGNSDYGNVPYSDVYEIMYGKC